MWINKPLTDRTEDQLILRGLDESGFDSLQVKEAVCRLQNVTDDGGSTQPSLQRCGSAVSGLRRPRCEPPSGAEVEKDRSYSTAPPIHLHGVQWDDFALFIYRGCQIIQYNLYYPCFD
jgi:hypothetical protein